MWLFAESSPEGVFQTISAVMLWHRFDDMIFHLCRNDLFVNGDL